MSRYTRRRREVTVHWNGSDPRPHYIIGTEYIDRHTWGKNRRNRYMLAKINKKSVRERPAIIRDNGPALLKNGGKP